MSTQMYQERESSSRWQREVTESVIAGREVIVAEFFDVGISRRLPWPERPQAAALRSAAGEPDRGFDAVVVGEYERAFQDDQAASVAATLDRHGVRLWLPEAGGPVDLTSATHQALLLLLGAQSKREVLRSRHRVLTAMRGQVRMQAVILAGALLMGIGWPMRVRSRIRRTPAGDAGRIAWLPTRPPPSMCGGSSPSGWPGAVSPESPASSTTGGVPCPSRVDRRRNPHRSGEAWTLRTVACILANPRYTGRQVWNRHGTDHDADDVNGERARGWRGTGWSRP